jgi:hypothetical protein
LTARGWPGVERVRADALEPASLEAALRGIQNKFVEGWVTYQVPAVQHGWLSGCSSAGAVGRRW